MVMGFLLPQSAAINISPKPYLNNLGDFTEEASREIKDVYVV